MNIGCHLHFYAINHKQQPTVVLYNETFGFASRILWKFNDYCTRKDTASWFRCCTLGLITREDKLGVTSIVRGLSLDGDKPYESLIHLFRSEAINDKDMYEAWYEAVLENADLIKVGGRVVFASDGVKVCKEGLRMPAVKKLHQESDDSSKPEYIFGHLFGCVGILADTCESGIFCIPLKCNIQDGMRNTSSWEDSPYEDKTHVVQSIEAAHEAASVFGNAYVLMDRYFLTIPALKRMRELNALKPTGEPLLHLITKAKSNVIAYEKPHHPQKPQKGRPKKRGAEVRLADKFEEGAQFIKAKAVINQEEQEVAYKSYDLLWGGGLYQEMRFVLVKYQGLKSILATTDLTLDPKDVISLYSKRFGIESSFRCMKQDTAAFGYRFWSTQMPLLNRFAKQGDPDRLEAVQDKHAQKLILKAARAIERFVLMSSVATGIVQLIASRERFGGIIDASEYKRSKHKTQKVSERCVIQYMRKHLMGWVFSGIGDEFSLANTQFIRKHMQKECQEGAKTGFT